jgi:maltoporin
MRAVWIVAAVACAWPRAAAGGEQSDAGASVGSYGRVSIGTDLRGGTPEPVAVVQHGARIIEPSYLELDLYYDWPARDGIDVRAVATVAFGDALFHYDGEFDATIALRNLYAEATIRDDTGVWVGSRMYRGDDVYLLDWWPLDDYNTVGGGAWWRQGPWNVRGHAGAHRLRDPFQFQEVDVPDPEFGSTTIAQLDRQRLIASVTPSYVGPSYKAIVHFDVQGIGDGERRLVDESIEKLPSDSGWTAGAQVGAWGFGPGASHANLFVRYARGLAAFDELDVPDGLSPDKRATGASEFVAGAAAAYEFPHGGVVFGGYTRRFVDADPNENDRDDGWEYIADVRPYAYLFDQLHAAVDVSYQQRFPRGVSPVLARGVDPAVFQIAPMLVLSPQGGGAYARPHLRLVYRGARLNEGARDLYPAEDARHAHRWQHFLGLQAEWWFNSSTYR